ncbi:MAG: molybdopterin molybdotransferase MoeA [Hyphomicrobiales bacterium]|nr:molybdopterin molybdotransferase MoeA [Hyphomicrobiales bacterium]
MAPKSLLPVADALARILDAAKPIAEVDTVPLAEAFGRTLARALTATRTQPPFDVSAMDGYGLRAADLSSRDDRVKLVGESAAGKGFAGAVKAGECVRIFTGAPVPRGVDTILIQEDAIVEGDLIGATEKPTQGKNIREAGLDFRAGEAGLMAGARLGPAELALAAAMNHALVPVTRRPRVAILATGDELVPPGETPGPDQIVCSNPFAVAAYVEGAGGEPVDLGIAGDTFADLERAIARAKEMKADVLVTLGGASVGDHDLVQSALAKEGMQLGFWRIAMRPGKPLIHGALGPMHIIGLPGNPVSSIVCTLMFLIPLVRKLSGDPSAGGDHTQPAILGADIKANDQRMDFLRATLTTDAQGRVVATPHALQDSSLLSVFSKSQALLLRAPHAPAAKAGDQCRIIRLERGGF